MTDLRDIQAHFNSAADRRKALELLDPKEHPKTPYALQRLVRAGKVPPRYVKTVEIKVGGFSKSRKPKDDTPLNIPTIRLGSPFIASEDGPSIVARIAQACPKGFRSPSAKAKNWQSTSLVEKVNGIVPALERSTRGNKKAYLGDYRAAVVATQAIHNIQDKYLNRGSRARKQEILAELRATGYPERAPEVSASIRVAA